MEVRLHHGDERTTIWHGDALAVLRGLPDASVDAVCTDPPYGLEFMGKTWDRFDEDSRARAGMTGTGYTDGAERLERPSFLGGLNPKCRSCGKWQRGGNPCSCDAPDFPNERRARSAAFGDWCLDWTAECFRVLKPGGHLLAFGGTRTWHRLACAVEDAGFEVRDSIAWLYGSGFPKSLDVSKAIDKARDDREDILRVTSTLAELAQAAGITRADIDAHMGTSDMGGWWLSTLRHRCACPSVENWTRLRDFIPGAPVLDDLVWKLNGRKGQPGEAWGKREVVGKAQWSNSANHFVPGEDHTRRVHLDVTAPATDAAQQWAGWGTALKPAFEPVVVARKPLIGTVASNVLQHGTGALNIDATRVPGDEDGSRNRPPSRLGSADTYAQDEWTRTAVVQRQDTTGLGRWPTNVLLDDTQAAELDQQSGVSRDGVAVKRNGVVGGMYSPAAPEGSADQGYGGEGGASRFFPTFRRDEEASAEALAKADRLWDEMQSYRASLAETEQIADALDGVTFRYEAKAPTSERPRVNGTAHPTVKPLDLMRWLVRLVTPPGGTVLEPFAGSGTTVEACIVEGFHCIAIEREADYLPLIMQRVNRRRDPVAYIKAAGEELGLFDLEPPA